MPDYSRIAGALVGKPPSQSLPSNPDGDMEQDPQGEGGEDRLSQTMEKLSGMPPDALVNLIVTLASQEPVILDMIDGMLSDQPQQPVQPAPMAA
jgi:hypothetical protein